MEFKIKPAFASFMSLVNLFGSLPCSYTTGYDVSAFNGVKDANNIKYKFIMVSKILKVNIVSEM